MAQFQTNILFWNIQKSQPTHEVAAIVRRYEVDIVLLAESGYTYQPADLESALNSIPVDGARRYSELAESRDSKVQIFSRLRRSDWRQLRHRSRYDIWRLRRENGEYLYLAAAHFTAIQNEQGDGQRKCAIDLRLDIDSVERSVYRRVPDRSYTGLPLLVIGDLNASPFDGGVAGVYGLNATQRRSVARSRIRLMDGIFYPFLYNPMWQFFGAPEDCAPGTFYKRLSKSICYDWYILDQVLLRPALLNQVRDCDVRIIEHTGVTSLVGFDHRPSSSGSDHLPILVSIKL